MNREKVPDNRYTRIMMKLSTYWLNPLIYICILHRALYLYKEKRMDKEKILYSQDKASGRSLCSGERLLASLSSHCSWARARHTAERQLRQLLNWFAMIRTVWPGRKIKLRTDLETISWDCSPVLQCFRFTLAMPRPGTQLSFCVLLDTVLSGQCVATTTSADFPPCYHTPTPLSCVRSCGRWRWSFGSRCRYEALHQLPLNCTSWFSIQPELLSVEAPSFRFPSVLMTQSQSVANGKSKGQTLLLSCNWWEGWKSTSLPQHRPAAGVLLLLILSKITTVSLWILPPHTKEGRKGPLRFWKLWEEHLAKEALGHRGESCKWKFTVRTDSWKQGSWTDGPSFWPTAISLMFCTSSALSQQSFFLWLPERKHQSISWPSAPSDHSCQCPAAQISRVPQPRSQRRFGTGETRSQDLTNPLAQWVFLHFKWDGADLAARLETGSWSSISRTSGQGNSPETDVFILSQATRRHDMWIRGFWRHTDFSEMP